MIGWAVYIVGYVVCAIWSKEPVGSLLWPVMLYAALFIKYIEAVRERI